MAALDNRIINDLMKQAAQPIQFVPPAAQHTQQVQQTFKPQQYAHSYNNTPVVRDGVQYNGTHTMTFGKRDPNNPMQQLGNPAASSFPAEQRAASQANYNGGYRQQGGGGAAPIWGSFNRGDHLGNGNPLLAGLRERSDQIMRDTVTPIQNRKSAMELLKLGTDYQTRMQGLQNEQAYRNSMIGIENDKLKMQGQEMQYNQDYRMKSLEPKPTYTDPYKAMEQRQKIIPSILKGVKDWNGKIVTDPALLGRIENEYVQRGRLPQYVKDGQLIYAQPQQQQAGGNTQGNQNQTTQRDIMDAFKWGY